VPGYFISLTFQDLRSGIKRTNEPDYSIYVSIYEIYIAPLQASGGVSSPGPGENKGFERPFKAIADFTEMVRGVVHRLRVWSIIA